MSITLVCPQCDQSFSVKPSHADKRTYCSRQCMAQAYKERLAGDENPNFRNAGWHVCPTCKRSFRSYKRRAKFCSRKCRANAPEQVERSRQLARENFRPLNEKRRNEALSRRTPKQKALPLRFTSKKRFICEVCGSEGWSYIERVTCSRKCAGIAQEKKVPVSCVICGKEYEVTPSVARYRRKITCGKLCERKYASIRQRGSKSHRWQGGKTEKIKLVRNSASYKQWRSSVFGRDDYTCQMCGERGGRLAAHHIRPFAKHKELRLTVGNGITLCWPCHHSIKGREADYEDVFYEAVCE